MFKKILIANRGEIACRIAQTARQMGIGTVAVYSDADRAALHVSACDEAIHIGPPAPGDSYLLADKVMAAAKQTGAEAIHPGYGFLSENAAFAEACSDNGLVFIGPTPAAIRSMGSKSAARRIMIDADVPVLPGYEGDDQSDAVLIKQAQKIGFPLLIKAVSGGGGKGMRVVEAEDQLLDALAAVKRESLGAFGDDQVLLERYLPVARHIEIQVFADTQGNVVHLFERDCSMQRRHQKVIEEAPAPLISETTRASMAAAAVQSAKAVDYVGAGTVEFLLAPDERFYFMEMNTRLQVEHPVTEMISGQDLVEWQLRVAAGEPLPRKQDELEASGHAFEARIYAESPEQGFLPSTGQLELLRPPQASDWIRVETGVSEGDEISPYYDPMIAKLVAWGTDREQALARLTTALKQYHLIGPKNNIRFLTSLCEQPEFAAGGTDTRFIENHLDALFPTDPANSIRALIAAAVYGIQKEDETNHQQQQATEDRWSPWAVADGWRMGGYAPRQLQLSDGNDTHAITVHRHESGWQITIGDNSHHVILHRSAAPIHSLTIDGKRLNAVIQQTDHLIRVLVSGQLHSFEKTDPRAAPDQAAQTQGSLIAPMPGAIIACYIKPGDQVSEGQALMVVEAMKMEHTISAPEEGTIEAVFFKPGDQVNDGDVLLAFLQ